MLRTQSW